MASLFSSPSTPKPPAIPVIAPPPKVDDPAVLQAAADAAAQRNKARGYRSTLLTNAMQRGSPGAPALKDTFGA